MTTRIAPNKVVVHVRDWARWPEVIEYAEHGRNGNNFQNDQAHKPIEKVSYEQAIIDLVNSGLSHQVTS